MSLEAYLPIVADRYGACVRHIYLVGLDLTGIGMRAQVRLDGDTPGPALVDLLAVTNGNAEGLRLVEVTTENGLPTSHIEIVINETTMERLPYLGERGDATQLRWDMQITLSGRKRRLAKGEFEITGDGVTGADAAPVDRPIGYGRPLQPITSPWKAARLTFGEEQVTVQIVDAELVAPLVGQAQVLRDQTADLVDRGEAAAALSGEKAAAASLSATTAAGFVGGIMYATTAAGLAAVAEGTYFTVAGDGTNTYAILYRKVGGAAVYVVGYPSKDALDVAVQGLANAGTLRNGQGSGAAVTDLIDRKARYYRLPGPLNRREDNDGDYIIDDGGDAWQMPGRIADIRPDLPTLGALIARGARGASLTIGVIGDSTVDGALTTDAIDNPTSGADPTWGKIPSANSDHTSEAPNAWPAVLRQILRDHYANPNIQVWNGGYGGQRCSGDDYWAAHWYSKIFAGNPNYGSAPMAALIKFGLNDANTSSATMVSDYLRGLQALCAAARGAGSVPVVLSPMSVVNPSYTFRLLRELVPALRTWCRDQGVDFVDAHAATSKYWAINGRVKMAAEIVDFVHPGDQLHGFLAGYVATQLCADIRRVTADAEGIGAFEVWADAAASSPEKNLAADSRYGGWTNTAGITNLDQIDGAL